MNDVQVNNYHGNFTGYRGTVTIKTMQGDSVLHTKTFYNKGLPKFFSNICELIAAADLRRENLANRLPRFLRLYTFKNSRDLECELDADEIKGLASNTVSLYSMFNTVADADYYVEAATVPITITNRVRPRFADEDNINSAEIQSDDQNRPSVSLQWRIKTQSITSDKVFFMVLFSGELDGAVASTDCRDALAYYKLTEKDGDTIRWSPISVNKTAYDCSILVEWKLEFDNAGAFNNTANVKED